MRTPRPASGPTSGQRPDATGGASRSRAFALSAEARAATLHLRATEQLASDTAGRIDALAGERALLEEALRREAAGLRELLPVIERLSLYPAQTLLASQAAPRDALTALMVLRGLGSELEARAERQRARERALALLAGRLRAQQRALLALREQQIDALRQATGEADAAAALQRGARDPASERSRRQADRAAAAGSLRDALARVQAAPGQVGSLAATEPAAGFAAPPADRRPRPPLPPDAGARSGTAEGPAPRGALVPVAGRLVRGWGGDTDAGPASGLTYAPPPLALVASPCDARVEFAAPFRSFGRMLILDCGGGWRFVLAGLDRLDVAVGETVPRGAPVGRMPDWSPGEPGSRPTLYMQLRHGTEPVDPAPFLRRPA